MEDWFTALGLMTASMEIPLLVRSLSGIFPNLVGFQPIFIHSNKTQKQYVDRRSRKVSIQPTVAVVDFGKVSAVAKSIAIISQSAELTCHKFSDKRTKSAERQCYGLITGLNYPCVSVRYQSFQGKSTTTSQFFHYFYKLVYPNPKI